MMMETYYRKRIRKTNQSTSVMDQSYPKQADQVSITAADFPALDRRLNRVPPPPSSHHEPEDDDVEDNRSDMQSQIEPGYLYEINHKHLPPRTPVHLRSIRVVMVSEKTELNVGVRFPSKESLRAFFNYSTRETHPALDEKFVMGIALAEKVLGKLVEAEMYSEQKSLVTFWMTDTSAHHHHSNNNITVTHKKGTIIKNNGLTEALKRSGMMRWGIRRQVKYLGRHNNSNDKEIITHDGAVNVLQNPSSSSFTNGIEGWSKMELEVVRDDDDERGISMEERINGDAASHVDEHLEEKDDDDNDDDDDEEGNGDDQEDENEEGGEENDDKENLKRKRYSFRNLGVKKPKKENLADQIKKQKNKKDSKTKKNKGGVCRFKEALVLRDPKDRWSAQRYKLAEQNLLSVMKSKGATAEKPLLRPQLRAEARKKIGDTGLLDHLLKHMAGKLAPDGKERFRRRHNPDGAMEYWLESADLVNIRRDAGITDPYWVPPPGWKPGDSPTQDPICAGELKLLKDGITKLESDFMATKMKLEDEVGKLRRELEELSSSKRKQEEENQAMTIASSRSDISQKLDQLATSFDSSKCDVGSSVHVPVEKYKEQLMVISDFVKDIETRIAKSTLNIVEERSRKESSLMVPTYTHKKEPKHAAEALIIAAASSSVKKTCKNQNSDQLNNAASEKAAKIQRMKSGFRICKPHGTFLWPNMVKDNSIVNSSSSTQVMVQVEVPTPPSVNSSNALAPPQLLVKPLAEKRAVKLKVSTVSKGQDNYHEEDGASSYSNYNAALINLNSVPAKPNAMPLTQVLANARSHEMEVAGYHRTENSSNNKKNTSMCCCPCPSDMSNWLALSNLKSVSDESTHGC
ncbi:hypothetical protein OROGR_022735 [Orobanche gracilis]